MIDEQTKRKIFERRWQNLKKTSIGYNIKTPKGLKQKLWEKFKNTDYCEYCGCKLNHKNIMTTPSIDHKTPRSKGGTNDINNLAIVCYSCNLLKGTMNADLSCEIVNLMKEHGKKDLLTRWKKESITTARAQKLERERLKQLQQKILKNDKGMN